MRISVFSAFYPFRGGIAQFNARLFRALEKRHDVKAFTFTTQYPKFLFPGKTQFVSEIDIADKIPAQRIVNPFNPFTYFKAIKKIRNSKPDILIVNHWMSFFGFCFRFLWLGANKGTIKVVLIHNLFPHEKRFFDRVLTSFFLKKADAYIVLSDSVREDLLSMVPQARFLQIEHPWYDQFGEKQIKADACEYLNIDKGKKTILFFGLIRDYKGLDLLIEAFSGLSDDHQLLIAGEIYGNDEKYQSLISSSEASGRIHFIDQYIGDEEVKWYFSASDICVLPYRSATQSGVTATSFHFEVPVVVTDVGGLRKTVENCGGGIIAESVDPESIRSAMVEILKEENYVKAVQNIRIYAKENSWDSFADRTVQFVKDLKK
jgi:glycosyltransferase involved in cell wall biosynthesis